MLPKKPFKKGMGGSIAPYYKAAGGVPLSITSSAINVTFGTPVVTVPTISAGDLVLVVASFPHSVGPPYTATSANLTFTQEFGVYQQFTVLWAVASVPLTNEAITINDGNNVIGLSVAGANTVAPFDGTPIQSGTGSPSITTTHANDLVIGFIEDQLSYDASPWVGLQSTTYETGEYQIVSAAGTYSPTFGGRSTNSIILAVKGAS